MAYGCNLGPETMARLTTDVTYADIQRITDWYLHEEALRAALADIVNAIAALDTTQVWGDGRASSSDGQRFLFPRRVLRRTYSHRLGDYRLGILYLHCQQLRALLYRADRVHGAGCPLRLGRLALS